MAKMRRTTTELMIKAVSGTGAPANSASQVTIMKNTQDIGVDLESVIAKYSPDQERADDGKWSAGCGSGSQSESHGMGSASMKTALGFARDAASMWKAGNKSQAKVHARNALTLLHRVMSSKESVTNDQRDAMSSMEEKLQSMISKTSGDDPLTITIMKRRDDKEDLEAIEKSVTDGELVDAEDQADSGADELTEGDKAALAAYYTNKAAGHAQDAAFHTQAGRTADAADSTKKAQRALRDSKRVAGMAAIAKREFTADQRAKDAKSGAAMPGGGFPIENLGDLKNAMRALGRAKDPALAKAHIRSRAKALGLEGELSDAFKKSAGDGGLSDDPTNADGGASMADEKEVAELKAQVEVLKREAQLNDAEKAFAKALPIEERAAFVAKSASDRAAALKIAIENDPVIYKSTVTGREFRKSADPEKVEFAKQADAITAENAELKKSQSDAKFAKSAEDLKHLPGTVEEKAVLLKSLAGVIKPTTEQIAASEKILKAASSGLAKAFERAGVMGSPETGHATDADSGVAEIMKSDPKITKAAATAKFWESPRGREIRNEMNAARKPTLT